MKNQTTSTKHVGRTNALAILRQQLERGTKPVKGPKPVITYDGDSSMRLDNVPLDKMDMARINRTIYNLECKLSSR